MVIIPASPRLNVGVSGGLTIEGWIRPSSTALYQPIAEWYSAYDGIEEIGAHFYLGVDSLGGGVGSLYANLVDSLGGSHQISTAPGLVAVNTFTHVAVTYDKGTGNAKIYVNGQPRALNGGSATFVNLGVFSPKTDLDLILGSRDFWEMQFFGRMDELSLYKKALSDSEILSIYSSGKCF
jgi:hypothetical protein